MRGLTILALLIAVPLFAEPPKVQDPKLVLELVAEAPNIVRGRVEQIVFEGPTVRLIVDAAGTAIKATAGGLERLTLLDQEQRDVLLRLQDVTFVREGAR